jgi:hypothetical protein
MLACFPSISRKFFDDQKRDTLIGDRGTIKHGFIIGPYDSSTLEGDLLVLNAAFRSSPY